MKLDLKNISDKELIHGCLDESRTHQEHLYRKFADSMYSVALNYSDNDDEACDILQEGFIRVFRSLEKFSFNGSFEGWIRRIIVNTALEAYRKKTRERENVSVYTKFIDYKVESILETIHAKEIINLVNELPKKAGLVLKLYSIEGYSHKEIAEQLCVSVGTSKSQLNRARFLLKEAISKANG